MKVLFIANTYLNEKNGGVYATKAYINAFATISSSMTLLYSMKEGAEPDGLLADKIQMIPIYDHRTRIRKFVDLCRGIVTRYQLQALNLVDLKDFDVVVFNNSETSSGLISHCKEAGLKVITIHHNYQVEYLLGDEGGLLLLPRLLWTLRNERRAVRESDLNLTLTHEDISLLKKHYGGDHYAVLGVFESEELPNMAIPETPGHGHRYVITGWLGSRQTEKTLIPWIKTYYPLLKQIDPDSRLTIAGKSPSKNLKMLAIENGIQVIDSPKDMQPILDNADFYICPTDRGGGLKLRIMDGLKSGLPVLTHKVSARGYDYMSDEGFLLSYDSPESFIKGIKILKSSKLSKRRIRTLYSQIFAYKAGVKRLQSIVKKNF